MAPLLCMMITLMIQVSCHIEKKSFIFLYKQNNSKVFFIIFYSAKNVNDKYPCISKNMQMKSLSLHTPIQGNSVFKETDTY